MDRRRQTDVSRSLNVIPSLDETSFNAADSAAQGLPSPRVDAASRLLEADDVAEYLGMRTDWVYREVRAGRLPHIRLGRAVRFRRESIDAWLASRERGASTGRRS